MLLEVCIDSPDGLTAAVSGGADRLEVCAALALGGLTPPTILMTMAVMTDLPCVAMIRARDGDFVWSRQEMALMQGDIEIAAEMGCTGVVLGASLSDGRLDVQALQALVAHVPDDMEMVLHRCIDLTPDAGAAVDQAVDLGFHRILTSGGAPRVMDGLDRLLAMITRADGRITIMPGSGITAQNVGRLLSAVQVDEIHASCAEALPQDPASVAMGFSAGERRQTSARLVRAMRAAIGT
jgi:copper homeostasis protein